MSEIVQPVIGLEIHVELATATKMFCRCKNHFGDEPNTNVCPVCTSMPGALPVMNAQAVDFSMKVGLALGCSVPDYTKWDRKSYYYPDLPKGYQISQYDLPLCANGHMDIPLADGSTKRIRILRAHLEEDAGKNSHDNPRHTGVDLNRAGVPLLEIVTEPDLHTVEEVGVFARQMQRLVRWLGVSEANMQMGHMRFEPNVNLHIESGGKLYKTPIIEVKNLNSFRSLEGTVNYEIRRQLDEWRADPDGYVMGKRTKENRGYDDATGRTVHQRHKEEADEYRYFPDPDLPAVLVDDAWRDRVQASVGEPSLARKQRFIAAGLTDEQADGLTQDVATGDLLDAAVAGGADPAQCAKLLMGKAAALANEQDCTIAEIGLGAKQLAELAKLLTAGDLNATAGGKVFDAIIGTDDQPKAVAESAGLLSVKDSGQIEQWVDDAIAANPQAVDDVRSGGKSQKKAFGFLTGQVMQVSRGAAPPQDVQALLREKLGM